MCYNRFMKFWKIRILIFLYLSMMAFAGAAEASRPVYIIPVRDDIEESIVYIVRRGMNEAIDHNAEAVILDMDTNGGRGDAMIEIMELLENFKGNTITYVNTKAYSAGAFIAVATKHIYMAPSSVIGAAAPVMMAPTGDVQQLPSTVEKKYASAYSARIRAAAQRNGHNAEVVDAMVKETEGLMLDGKEIIKKGEILTLTYKEAAAQYGTPPKSLLAEGIAENIHEVLGKLGYAELQIYQVEATGAEKLARFITLIAPLLLMVGIGGIYLEFKTPGISIFGIIGVIALAIFFFGHYVAGLSGMEEVILFLVGLILIAVELFILPGHVLPGFLGIVAILISVLWAMVDKFSGAPIDGSFNFPSFAQLQMPLLKLGSALVGTVVLIVLFLRWLPKDKGPLGKLILQTQLDTLQGYSTAQSHQHLLEQIGVAETTLRPSGKGRFGDELVDVITQGDLIEKGKRIKVVQIEGVRIIVAKTN